MSDEKACTHCNGTKKIGDKDCEHCKPHPPAAEAGPSPTGPGGGPIEN